MVCKLLLLMSVTEHAKGNTFSDKCGITPGWDCFFLLTPAQCKASFFPSDYPPPDFEHLPTVQLAMRKVKLHLRSHPNNRIQHRSLSQIGALIGNQCTGCIKRTGFCTTIQIYCLTIACTFNFCEFQFSLYRMEIILTYLRVIL